VDSSATHFEVLGLDESVTIVRRQIEEAYEKRAAPLRQRVEKLGANAPEAAGLRARLTQLNAARAVLVPRKHRDEYKLSLQKLRDAERDLERESGKKPGEGKGSSAVLILHLRQQVERAREELQKLHERHYKQHASGEGDDRSAGTEDEAEADVEEKRRRTVRAGARATALAELAARRPVRRA
jgi:hypothetical protein